MELYRYHDRAITPTKQRETDVGLDLICPETLTIRPNTRITVNLGLGMRVPRGFFVKIESRSSIARNYGLLALGGVIDAEYTAEIKVILTNIGTNDIRVPRGTAIAQAIVLPCLHLSPVWAPIPTRESRPESGSSDLAGIRPRPYAEEEVVMTEVIELCRDATWSESSSQEREIEGHLRALDLTQAKNV